MNQESESARLKALFANVEPVEVMGIEPQGKTPQQIASLLPRFTTLQQQGSNPAFGLLFDPQSKRIWALRSGLSPQIEETLNGIRFKSGTMTQAVAKSAGGVWGQAGNPLGAHIEGQAAAFMRKKGIIAAVLYINGSTPCLGPRGCKENLQELLAEDATLTVYNKNGRRFFFTGLPDGDSSDEDMGTG